MLGLLLLPSTSPTAEESRPEPATEALAEAMAAAGIGGGVALPRRLALRRVFLVGSRRVAPGWAALGLAESRERTVVRAEL